MLRQKKSFKFKFKNISKKKRSIKRLKKIFKHKNYYFNPIFQTLLNTKKEIVKTQININVTPNNIFCTLKDLSRNKILLIGSSGKYKINISKKTLKFKQKIIVLNFIEEIKKYLTKKLTIICITGPIKIRKNIIKQISLLLKNYKFLIKIKEVKCFNGCRPKKKKRKKQKGLRIFK
jgi:ribosomal protein S11